MDKAKLLSLTSEIVTAHVSSNAMSQKALLSEIDQVFKKLASLAGVERAESGGEEAVSPDEEAKRALPLEAAFGTDRVFCMVCGQGMKTLKRHLFAAHGMKPGQYRREFGIPTGTPLVAKSYSEARKKMAKDLNLAEGLAKARAARGKKRG